MVAGFPSLSIAEQDPRSNSMWRLVVFVDGPIIEFDSSVVRDIMWSASNDIAVGVPFDLLIRDLTDLLLTLEC